MIINIKRSRRKSVAIKVTEKGELFVLCPLKFSNKEINKLIQQKQTWINKAIQKVQQKYLDQQDYYNYKKIMFLGKSYNINIDENFIKIGDNAIKYKKGSNIKNFLKQWLIKQANAVILQRLDNISDAIKTNYKSAKIISARKKWGSCDNLNNINLNFRLVMLPLDCIDYVCIHELCHIKHMNHSKLFWNEVEKYTNHKEINKVVKEFSFVLELF